MAVEIAASDWNKRIKDAVVKISSQIPEVGTAVSVVVALFWPENKIDIFQALKKDIKNLIHTQILERELNQHQSEIEALKITIKRYTAAQTNEKGHYLSNWITEADRLSVIFRRSTNNIHLILLIISLALLHLTGLWERLNFGKELYHEDNTHQWKEDLEEMYKTYIVDFLPEIFKQWRMWRVDQVKIKTWKEARVMASPPVIGLTPCVGFYSYASVEDTITGERKKFSVFPTGSALTPICEDNRTRMCNDAITDMAGCISPTFLFHKLLPDNRKSFPKYDKEVFGRMFRGPYSEDLFWTEREFGPGNRPYFRTRPYHDDYAPNSGPITKVILREWNSIDAMQFIYASRQGHLAGNAEGGEKHEIDVADRPINGLCMGFSNGVLTYVQIIYHDGTSSSTYGNRGNWKCDKVSPKGPSAYRLNSWSYAVDNGPSGSRGPSVIQLEYGPQTEA